MSNRTVILVDDERAVTDMYRLALEMRGYEVSVHKDAPGLFEGLERSLPDMVVLDWNLPSVSGGQILERIRMDERTRRLRVMILSNAPRRQYADGVISRLGVLAWLEKVNTTPVDLADRIAQLFGEPAPTL